MTSRAAGKYGVTGTSGLTNVIVRLEPTGWDQAAGQQPGEHGQPEKRATQPGSGSIHWRAICTARFMTQGQCPEAASAKKRKQGRQDSWIPTNLRLSIRSEAGLFDKDGVVQFLVPSLSRRLRKLAQPPTS